MNLFSSFLPNIAQAQGLAYQIQNPLDGSGITSIETLVTSALNILLVIAVPVIVFFIIYAGFNYVTARGNADKVKKASTALWYAIIGAVLILGAVVVGEIIAETVCSFSPDAERCSQ